MCGIYFLNHHRLTLCFTCSDHVSWLVYFIHDCGCCDVRGWASVKFFKAERTTFTIMEIKGVLRQINLNGSTQAPKWPFYVSLYHRPKIQSMRLNSDFCYIQWKAKFNNLKWIHTAVLFLLNNFCPGQIFCNNILVILFFLCRHRLWKETSG